MLIGKTATSQTLYQHYKLAVSSKNYALTYWQKQWLKHVFGVEKAIELQQFEPTFQTKIYQYLEKLQ